jgi:drug/metabolite transporter (DMT)-like permease
VALGTARAGIATPVLAGALCLLWALTFLAQRTGVGESDPRWFVALRVTIAAAAMLPFLPAGPRLDARSHGVALALALVNQVAFVSLQVAGLVSVGAGPAAAIIYLQPLLVLLGARLALGEPLTGRRVAAAVLGFAGVALVSLGEASVGSGEGVLLLLAASAAWSVGTLITRAAAAVPALPLVALQHLYAVPFLVAIALLGAAPPEPTPTLVTTVLYAGVGGSAAAWLIWTTLLARGDAGVVSTWLFSVPILAAVLGVLVLGEPVTPALAGGVALVAAGIRLVATRG